MSPSRHARGALEVSAVLLVLTLGIGAFVTGVRMVPVLTGSMAPLAPAGSLVLTTPLAPSQVREGDVVAFAPPAAFDRGRPVLHRVVEVTAVDGTPAMRTQGDANPGIDPWTVDLSGADVAQARLVVPHLGRAVAGGPAAAMLMAAGAVVLVAGAPMAHAARRRRCTCSPALSLAASGSAPPGR